METLRTPDDRFAGLPDFDFAAHYVEVADGAGGRLRVHHLDEGPPGGEVVLLMHGEPSWSFLYRHMIPVLVDAGLRCVAPDLVGFGRSDNSELIDDASDLAFFYLDLLDALELDSVHVVGQCIGGWVALEMAILEQDLES